MVATEVALEIFSGMMASFVFCCVVVPVLWATTWVVRLLGFWR